MQSDAITLRRELLMIRNEISALKQREAQIVAEMATNNDLAGNLVFKGEQYKISVVRSTTTVLNEKGLEKVLTAEQWKAACIQKLDRKKLENLANEGIIDPAVLSDFITVTEKTPYVKITSKSLDTGE